MAQVQTVQGPVDAEELGTVLIHEHVRFRDEAVAANWPAFYDGENEMAMALEQGNAAKGHGGGPIVDPPAMVGGRDVRFMKRVADETGVQIVACTGIYTYDFLPHYFENRSEDQIAEMFVEDIEPGSRAASSRPRSSSAPPTPRASRSMSRRSTVRSRASLQTGAPI